MPLFEAKPRAFFVQLQNNQQVFFSGMPVAGQVILDLIEEKRTRGVFIQLVGTVETHWTEQESYRDSNGETKYRTVTHSESIEICAYRAALWLPQGQESATMVPGPYAFPFSFVLPSQQFPPSYKGSSGTISYYLKAWVDRPWKWDHRTYCPITVLPFVDANHPQYAQEMYREDEKTMCCLCCASGPIIATVRVPSVAWCPGEVIPFAVHVDNRSSSVLSGVTCSLDNAATFYAHGRHTRDTKRVATTRHNAPIAGKASFDAVVLVRVPSCCPSIHLESARIIELVYTLETTVHLPAGSFNLHLKMPVEITTIPHTYPPQFRQPQGTPVAAPAPVAQAQAPAWATQESIAAAAAQGMPGQPPMAPPAYDDAFQSDATVSQIGGAVQYPFFPMPVPSAPSIPQVNVAVSGGETTPLVAGNDAYNRPQGPILVGAAEVQVKVNGVPAANGQAPNFQQMMFMAPAALAPVPSDR